MAVYPGQDFSISRQLQHLQVTIAGPSGLVSKLHIRHDMSSCHKRTPEADAHMDAVLLSGFCVALATDRSKLPWQRRSQHAIDLHLW